MFVLTGIGFSRELFTGICLIDACALLDGFFGCLAVEFCFLWRVDVTDELFVTVIGTGGGELLLCLRRSTNVDEGGLLMGKSICCVCRVLLLVYIKEGGGVVIIVFIDETVEIFVIGVSCPRL